MSTRDLLVKEGYAFAERNILCYVFMCDERAFLAEDAARILSLTMMTTPTKETGRLVPNGYTYCSNFNSVIARDKSNK